MRTSVHARPSPRRLFMVALLILTMLPFSGMIAVRNAQAAYLSRFTSTTNGAITFTGNTLGLSKDLGVNAPGTIHGIGTFISTNPALQDGAYPPGTTAIWRQNASAAALNIPAGSTVLYAELIWSGSYSYGGEDVSAFLDQPIRLTPPIGATVPITPELATAKTLGTRGANGTCISDPDAGVPTTIEPCFYVRSANVTNQVRNAGPGMYTVAGVPGTQADTPSPFSQELRNNAGWTLAVAYGNGALPIRNLTLFIGGEVTNRTQQSQTTITGFCTPLTGAVDGRLLVSASEGDATLPGDQMQFGPNLAGLQVVSGPNNPADNFFASQLNGDTGNRDIVGTFDNRNQDAVAGTNSVGGRQGWDVTNVSIHSPLLGNAQTSALVRGTTNGDQYVINALATQIDVGAPFFRIDVKTVDKNTTILGDTLTYTIRVDNTAGTADANNVLFRDPPPPGTSFVTGSVTVDGVAQPAASPIAGVSLGTVTMGQQPTSVKTVTFQVRVDSVPANAQISNSASWTYDYVSCAGQQPLSGSATTNRVTTEILLPTIEAEKVATLAIDADGNNAPSAGDTLRYDIAIHNTGASAATNVVYDDVPDPNTILEVGSVQTSQGTVARGNAAGDTSVGVSIGTMPPGADVTVSYRVRIKNPLRPDVKVVVNQGVVTSRELPPVPTSDPRQPQPFTPTIVILVPEPVLIADKLSDLVIDADGNRAPSAGDTLGYTVTIKNIGPVAATQVTYEDAPDVNTALIPGSVQTSQGTITGGNNGVAPVAVNIGVIQPDGSVTISYRVQIKKPLPASVRVIQNWGLVRSKEVPPIRTNDPRTPKHGDPTIVTIDLSPRLTADKTDILVIDTNGNGAASAGETLLYLITIANHGNGTAVGVKFADTPDPITRLVAGSVQTSQGVVTLGNAAGNTSVGVNMGDMPPGGSVTIGFRVRINNQLPRAFVANQGTISSANTPNLRTNDPDTPTPNDPTVTPIPSGATAVVLQSFTATRESAGVVVRWVTVAEINTWGFHLLRSADGRRDHAARVTPTLILGQGRGQGGASYVWTDTGAQPHVPYTYWLQETELNGAINEYGPTTVVPASTDRHLVRFPLVAH